ncbi:alpha/beta fold hydrolase [Aciduricibacillus chroicocephali]|uniref:Alpha/beta fold hydrolase n=1 Tax=Aciduricibacillus chroicocephali TaxID=3054939 RepID=A0ABY9KZY3_9BACI|nr:alpha/beta fold hydrolase [Bacillaceae bacterium 44XB]
MPGCLLIHGYTGSPAELEPLIIHLQKNTDWELLVPVLPGHGEEINLRYADGKEWIDTAEKALQSLKERHQTVHIIGFSMGGLIAAILAARHKIGKLVLLAAAGKFLPPRRLTADLFGFFRAYMKGRLKEDRYYNVLLKKTKALTWRANMEFLQLVQYGRKSLAEIKVPVLIMQGMRDGLVPYKTAHFLEKMIGASEKETILFERSRHFICLGEEREAVNRIVLEFLQRE